ncbi:hypothetical protein CA85_17690 [Allorhodopirellula solitaria]|uniref:Uncharacterized protein n=1 Tax=Allorhodopirellula solitaria TaxID=2527987 RepID=A0A5C5YFN8_9BACT|nr:hypothetical protein CA85_17690 [Allorhodopirellula solitaria]
MQPWFSLRKSKDSSPQKGPSRVRSGKSDGNGESTYTLFFCLRKSLTAIFQKSNQALMLF